MSAPGPLSEISPAGRAIWLLPEETIGPGELGSVPASTLKLEVSGRSYTTTCVKAVVEPLRLQVAVSFRPAKSRTVLLAGEALLVSE